LAVAMAMGCSGVVLLVLALSRAKGFQPGGKVQLGLAIAILGLITNAWFWRRYNIMTREHYSAIIAAQRGLYRAKSCVDLAVITALAAIAAAPAHPLTPYIDIGGSIAVALYLLWSSIRPVRAQPGIPPSPDGAR
jgi:divalent metal cation (Fe/Co/Zn/Cd) transporter